MRDPGMRFNLTLWNDNSPYGDEFWFHHEGCAMEVALNAVMTSAAIHDCHCEWRAEICDVVQDIKVWTFAGDTDEAHLVWERLTESQHEMDERMSGVAA